MAFRFSSCTCMALSLSIVSLFDTISCTVYMLVGLIYTTMFFIQIQYYYDFNQTLTHNLKGNWTAFNEKYITVYVNHSQHT